MWKNLTRMRTNLFLTGVLLLASLRCLATPASTNVVEAGSWTYDFATALRLSRENHRPLMVLAKAKDCPYCSRMSKALANPAFGAWARDANLYLVRANFYETNSSPVQAQAVTFVRESRFEGEHSYPFIGVYWPREREGEVRVAFPGRRGQMPGGQRSTFLEAEAVAALKTVLKEYFLQGAAASVKPFGDYLVKRIQVRCEGPGAVSMQPESGLLKSKVASVHLTAVAASGSVFKGWKGPDGRFLRQRMPKLGVKYQMSAGVYTAVFEEVK